MDRGKREAGPCYGWQLHSRTPDPSCNGQAQVVVHKIEWLTCHTSQPAQGSTELPLILALHDAISVRQYGTNAI